jgi:HSP20 family protein
MPFPFRTPQKLSVQGLQDELSNLVERWWHCGLNTGPLDGQDWAPSIELCEDLYHYVITMELPGVEPATLDITAQPTCLVICGRKSRAEGGTSQAGQLSGLKVAYTERRYGGFKRVISLPGPIQIDDVTAHLDAGVLEVRLVKSDGGGPNEKRITIDTEPARPDSSST